ncbi:MAG: PAS domain-containing protein [Sphingomonadaceae bacterium]|jgi:PAS domain S-box-containing protein|nr:PAS domain-containing protein [Sphingomonadaceae bacterium]NBU78101.1 PAS domain-containing protein [Sphingomonadaceae bacterium]NCA00990.1 PAS domain-containing protein [Sphingomonadaceae bacterium]
MAGVLLTRKKERRFGNSRIRISRKRKFNLGIASERHKGTYTKDHSDPLAASTSLDRLQNDKGKIVADYNIAPPGLSALIVNSPVASVISNPRLQDNPIIACNQAFIDLTGYAETEILGRNCRFLAGPATEPRLSGLIREGVRDKRPVLVEILNYKKDGTPFRNALLVAPIFDAEGELEYFLGSQVELPQDAPGPSASRHDKAVKLVNALTPRQREVLEHMAMGKLNKQIAYDLGLSEQTVKMHRAALLDRLGAATTADAIRIAVEANVSAPAQA